MRVIADNGRVTGVITQDEEGAFWMLGIDRLTRFDPVSLDTNSVIFEKPLPIIQLSALQDFINHFP